MTEPFDLDEPALRDRAVAAARGDAPFDLLITGAEIVDVALAVRRVADIGITGPLIASVHAPDQQATALDRIDASGMVISPGLIDAHMHVESSMVTPETYAGAVLPRGVTTIVWDPHEFGNVAGLAGVDYAIAAANRLDLRILTLAPSCVPSAPGYETAAADFGPEVMAQMMARYSARTHSSVAQTFQGASDEASLDQQALMFDSLLAQVQSGSASAELKAAIDDVSSKWQFIRGSYINYNENNVSFVIDRYSKGIIRSLTTTIEILESNA